MQCRTVPCCAVLCHAACFAVLAISFKPGIIPSIIPLHRVCTYYIVEYKDVSCSAQPSYSPAAQRSAVRCRMVPCLALRCCAVPCRAVFIFEHAVPGIMQSTWWYKAPVCTCLLILLLSSFDCPLSVLFTFFFANYTRAADQSVTSPTSTPHSTGPSVLRK